MCSQRFIFKERFAVKINVVFCYDVYRNYRELCEVRKRTPKIEICVICKFINVMSM